MKEIIIFTDSTCDLSKDLIEKYKIKVLPLHVTFDNGGQYLDGVDIFCEDVYKKQEELNTLPKTGVTDGYVVAILVTVCAISAIYAYKKIRDYNIK